MLARNPRALPALFACLLSALLLTGCAGRTVTVKYAPLFNTNWTDSPDLSKKTGILMVYCLVAIDNTGKNAVDFTFDPQRLYLQGPDKFNPGLTTIQSTTVQAGKVATKLGTLSIHADGASVPNQAWDPLFYTPIGSESVLMVQLPASPQPLYFPDLPTPLPDCPTLNSFSALDRPGTAPHPV